MVADSFQSSAAVRLIGPPALSMLTSNLMVSANFLDEIPLQWIKRTKSGGTSSI
jgi:hypothetical protein